MKNSSFLRKILQTYHSCKMLIPEDQNPNCPFCLFPFIFFLSFTHSLYLSLTFYYFPISLSISHSLSFFFSILLTLSHHFLFFLYLNLTVYFSFKPLYLCPNIFFIFLTLFLTIATSFFYCRESSCQSRESIESIFILEKKIRCG